MAKAKKESKEVEVQEEVLNNGVEVIVHTERWGSGTNTNVSPKLPSLDEE